MLSSVTAHVRKTHVQFLGVIIEFSRNREC